MLYSNQNTRITVLDAIMGSGKSEMLMDEINKMPFTQKFLYITPLLDECHRVAGTQYEKDDVYKRPLTNENNSEYIYDLKHKLSARKFIMPDYVGGNKANHLEKLLSKSKNITSTHQLFSKMTVDNLSMAKDYILIIDEAISVFENYSDMSVKETRSLFKKNILSVADDGYTLVFNRENFGRGCVETKDTRYDELATLCDMKQLNVIDESYIVWVLDVNLLLSFKEVWIATYMFEGSKMASYLKSMGIHYSVVNFGKSPTEFSHLINIIGVDDNNSYNDMVRSRHNKLNSICEYYTNLSSSHFKNDEDIVIQFLKKSMLNYAQHLTKSKKKQRYYTVFKDYSSAIEGKRFKNEWLPYNIKATNKYSECDVIAYLINLYAQPVIKRLCLLRGFPMSEEQYATSELVQWIWRSAIRNGNKITIYIPSMRMRELLICWLNSWDFHGKVGEHNQLKEVKC